jgi:hypothetical protein
MKMGTTKAEGCKMRRLFVVAATIAALSAFSLPVHEARAAATVLCAPEGIYQQIRQVYNPANPPPDRGGTGVYYTLNGQGCAIFAQGDVAFFISQGFTPGPPFAANILFTTGVWAGTTSFQIGALPPSTYIEHIIMQETAGNAVTGGVKVGTTSGGADVVAALTVGASSLSFTTDAALLKRVFSTTAVQPLFVTPATAGNSANVTVTVVLGYY